MKILKDSLMKLVLKNIKISKYTSMIEVKMEQGNDQDEKFNLYLKYQKQFLIH